MLHKSIRWRIQLWHGFLLSCLVLALMIAFYTYERHRRLGEMDGQLREAIQVLMPRIAPPGPRPGGDRDFRAQRRSPDKPGDGLYEPNRNGMDRISQLGIYYIGWDQEEEIVESSANVPISVPYPDVRHPTFRTRDGYREFINPTPRGEAVLVGISTETLSAALHRLVLALAGLGLVIVGMGMAIGWWVAGKALEPIAEISATAKKISEGDLSRRINVAETDSELGQLAQVLNGTFEKFERMIEDQLRFTADASHELRTPVAVLITQIQLALSRERSPEEYQKTLETCERAAERMRVLINQLIELARVDAGDASLVWEKCDLGRVVRDAIEFIEPLALKKHVTLHQSIEPVRIRADVMKLGQVLINLLNNAIHHNNDGIEVSVSVKQEAHKAVICIADNGVGIPEDALPHLFDRFYRVDKARARGKGNSGLGLAICKAIVRGHGGKISVQSKPGHGAQFTIELPAVGRLKPTEEESLVNLDTKTH
jgi:heavy metal sensor kinase